jgi:DNA-binding transcriptional LysR family regulator
MTDLWALRILIEVADRGSFSAAAGALVLTQPAVSRQMNGLERRFGVVLFHRRARGVTLTNAGETAVELARSVIARVDALEATMGALTGLDAGHLRLAAFPSVNTAFVPDAIRRFSAAHPGVTVTLSQVDPSDPLGAVTAGRVDLALLTSWQLYADPWAARTDPSAAPRRTGAADRLELVPLLDEDLQVALHDEHPLAGHATVRLRDLRDDTWIEGAYPDCLGPVPQLADALGGPPRIGFTCDDWNGKQALVAAGAGIMLVPTLARAAVRPDIRLRPTAPGLPTRRLYAAVPEPPVRTPAADAMLTLLAEIVPTVEPGDHADDDGRGRHPSAGEDEQAQLGVADERGPAAVRELLDRGDAGGHLVVGQRP